MMLGHLYSVSPEWAPGALDLEPLVLLLPLVDPLALLVVELERKLLRLKEQLGSKLAGELVSVLAPTLVPLPSVSRMAWPPLSALHIGGVCVAPQGASPPSHYSRREFKVPSALVAAAPVEPVDAAPVEQGLQVHLTGLVVIPLDVVEVE